MDQDERTLPIFPNLAMAWAQRAAELASLMGLAAIVTAESLVNLSRGPTASSEEVYRDWGSEPVEASRGASGLGKVLDFFTGPDFWAGLAAGGASAFAAVMLTRRFHDR